MPDGQSKYDKAVIVDVANKAIIADSVAPLPASICRQALSMQTRVFTHGKPCYRVSVCSHRSHFFTLRVKKTPKLVRKSIAVHATPCRTSRLSLCGTSQVKLSPQFGNRSALASAVHIFAIRFVSDGNVIFVLYSLEESLFERLAQRKRLEFGVTFRKQFFFRRKTD